MSIPFSRFGGRLKQLETNFNFPIMRDLFEAAFSPFTDLDNVQADMLEQGIARVVTAAGIQENSGRRPRRFAGDANLPPSRYFTLCANDGSYNDYGTLRDEMYGYYRGDRAVDVTIYDPNIDTAVFAELQKAGMISADDLRIPLYLFLYNLPRRTEDNKHLLDQYPEHLAVGRTFPITYGVRPFKATIDNTIDLRQPDTQDWFVKTFVELELANEGPASEATGMTFPPKKRLTSFAELLPVIASLETGGGNVFSQAVGAWLRQQGADALIFPSARSNARCRVQDGKVNEFRGWNLVLYMDAPPTMNPNLFGRAHTWVDPDHDHIRAIHTSTGPERGSLSIRGTKEWNLLHFDLERQIAHGTVDATAPGFLIGRITGAANEAITDTAKEFLDHESEKGRLWSRDLDTVWFVSGNESCWRRQDSAGSPDSARSNKEAGAAEL